MQSKIAKIFNIFPILLIICLGIGIFANLLTVGDLKLSALVSLGLALVLLLRPKFKKYSANLTKSTISKIIFSAVAVIILVQILILTYFPATVIHDPFRLLSQSEMLSRNNFDWAHTTYFFRYSQNVPNAILLSFWLRLTNIFNLSTNVAFNLLSIILLDTFIFLSLNTLQARANSNALVLGLTLFFLISPFAYTYYLQVVYSDLPIMLILLVTFRLLSHWQTYAQRQKIYSGLLLFVLILLGQMIKANLIVLAVAVVLFLIYLGVTNRQQLRKLALPLGLILVAFAAWLPAQSALEQSAHFHANDKYAFPTTHWIYMSYHPKTDGTYNAYDVQTMLSLPTLVDRQEYLQKALPQRLRKLGIGGILQRWFVKMKVLLNVSKIQHAYTGGYRAAPAFYQKHQQLFIKTGQLLYRLGMIIVYSLTILALLRLLKNPSKSQPTSILAIILALGYLAFHTLLWEVENRYGQAIFPLLLIIISQSQPNIATTTRNHAKLTTKIISAGLVASALVMLVIRQPQTAERLIVAAQRSQLSAQYEAKPIQITNTTVVQQTVQLNHAADRATVIMPNDSTVDISLVSLKDQTFYNFTKNGSTFVLNQHLAPGLYQIVIADALSKKAIQDVSITQTTNYQLAKYPLQIDQRPFPHQSLIYTFSRAVN